MAENLIIVESPNKIKTIKSYVGNDYDVIATYGHFRELNKTNGYDKTNFEPNWEIIKNKTNGSRQSIVKQIKEYAKKANHIYIATDPDREGEAIAWHVYDILDKKDQSKCHRITFNEVTKKAIIDAIHNYRQINMDLVYSQFARRILDRIVGYKLSNLVKKSLNAVSAGRVQSIALLFVVNRQLERLGFIPSKWYEIHAELNNGIELVYIDKTNKYEKYNDKSSSSIEYKFAKLNDAKEVLNELGNDFKLTVIDSPKLTKSETLKAITTDKLLQLAANNLGWNAGKTTLIAQKMFEGIEVGDKLIGLITYPRTDSERLSDEFTIAAKEFITKNYGNDYFNPNFNKKTNSQKNNKINIQDAHEAIRPVDISLTPNKIKDLVDEQTYKLYNLIWSRTISSLMNPPTFTKHNFYFKNNQHEFYTSYKKINFKGYYILDFYSKIVNEYDKKYPNLILNENYNGEAKLLEKDKLPPPYYTEASLIAELKESGVGRPSTYATMAKIGEERGYVVKEASKLIPTNIGLEVIEELKKDFPEIMTPEFTVNMENSLDRIANGEDNWQQYLKEFAPNFELQVQEAYKNIKKKPPELVGKVCPKCNEHELVYRKNRYGTNFIACSDFPKCKYTESVENSNLTGEKCPECNNDLVIKVNKKKQSFIGCSNYPNCTYVKNINNKYNK